MLKIFMLILVMHRVCELLLMVWGGSVIKELLILSITDINGKYTFKVTAKSYHSSYVGTNPDQTKSSRSINVVSER